jgi:iron complex transport system ATP-binding protein
MRLLHQLAHQTSKGILLSTHELELALQVADEVWLLQNTETFHRGAPEDLVLNGAFEEAFAHEDINFDKLTGTFSIQHDNRKPVLFAGEGLSSWWTLRALRRNGFFVVGSAAAGAELAPLISLIEKDGQPHWRLGSGANDIQEFDSIAALLAVLDQRPL